VTFRKFPPQKIVELVAQAGLDGIEWGGDIHVPHGDLEVAKNVSALTVRAGLAVSSYGSYYRVGKSEDEGLAFETVLATAQQLGAPVIRIWGGAQGSVDAPPEYWDVIAGELRRIGSLSQAKNIGIALELHGGTLTDNVASALQLMRKTDHPNVRQYWQIPGNRSFDECCADLRMLAGHVSNLHVFYHDIAFHKQRPLADGVKEWRRYLEIAGESPAATRYALLEFVIGGTAEQFLEDAKTLHELAGKEADK